MNQCPYDTWAPTTHEWCERQLCSWIREPANTFSNATYLIIGVLVLVQARKHIYPHLKLLGYFAILLSFMSGFYHATSSFFGEVLDYGSMFLISSYLLTANLSRLYKWSPTKMTIVASLIFILSVVGLVQFRTVGAPFFGVQISIALFVEIYMNKKGLAKPIYKPLWVACALFLVAYGIWNLDTNKIVCDPDNHFINGHAIWHILTGIAVWFLFKFYAQFELKHDKH
ncbi:MAG: ceramidase domain-containing protein [Bacteriovoracaceae bacterium]